VSYELISLSESSNVIELEKQINEQFEKALSNLINGITPPEDFPDGKIPQRPIRGGSQVNFVPGWWFIKTANALFQHRWSFDIIEHYIGENSIWVKGCVKVFVPDEEVTKDGVTRKRGSYTITKTQYGGSDIKRLKTDRSIISIGDDLKSAATDCMKKCFTQFGMAADIYGPRETKAEGSADTSQLDALYKVGERAGLDRDKVIAECEKEFGTRPEESTSQEILGLINTLRKRAKAA